MSPCYNTRVGTVAGTHIDRLFGPVELDPESGEHIGADNLSNNSAELSGVAQALLWLRAEGGTGTAYIFYDSDYAAGVARGRYRTKTNRRLARLVQRIAREENARRRDGTGRNGIVWTHIKGHAGHPGNEWADRLADIGRLQPFYYSEHNYHCAYPYELDE